MNEILVTGRPETFEKGPKVLSIAHEKGLDEGKKN